MTVDGTLLSVGSVDDRALRREVKDRLDEARALIHSYTGFYTHENLTEEVLSICNRVSENVCPDARLREAADLVEERCRQLAAVADRFAERDFESIAASRARAVAAVDIYQDVVLDLRRSALRTKGFGALLRRRAR